MRSRRDMYESLFSITRNIRESEGGEIACCGCFREDFVSLLPGGATWIDDAQSKTIIKVLKAVSGGARRVLRLAAEIQVGLTGVNWRQTTISQFYKPTATSRKPSAPRKNWTDSPSPPLAGAKNKSKTKSNASVIALNKNLNINNVFQSFMNINNVVYWEFRAG